jgi:hypothetical protein
VKSNVVKLTGVLRIAMKLVLNVYYFSHIN